MDPILIVNEKMTRVSTLDSLQYDDFGLLLETPGHHHHHCKYELNNYKY